MKMLKYFVIGLFAVATSIISCGNKQQSQQLEKDSNEVVLDTVAQQVASQADQQATNDAKVFEIIREFYKNYVFGKKETTDEVINKYCTKKLAKKLAADYDYDDGGYAIWEFRSDNQDGDSDVQEVTNVEAMGNGVYKVSFNDMGTKGSCRISVVLEGEKILFDEINK